MLFRVPAIAWKPFCIAKGDSLLRADSSLAEFITKYLGQFSLLIYSSLSESESEICLFCILRLSTEEAIFGNKGINHN